MIGLIRIDWNNSSGNFYNIKFFIFPPNFQSRNMWITDCGLQIAVVDAIRFVLRSKMWIADRRSQIADRGLQIAVLQIADWRSRIADWGNGYVQSDRYCSSLVDAVRFIWLWIADCRSRIADHGLGQWIRHCCSSSVDAVRFIWLWIADHGLQIADCGSRIADWRGYGYVSNDHCCYSLKLETDRQCL